MENSLNRLTDFEIDYDLGEISDEEKKEIETLVKELWPAFQIINDTVFRVKTAEGDTYFHKTNKIVQIEPVKGGIEAMAHRYPKFAQSPDEKYKCMWSTPEQVVIAHRDIQRELHIYFSHKAKE